MLPHMLAWLAALLGLGSAASSVPPKTAGAPVISGRAEVTQTVTASTGTWSGTTPMTYRFAWQRCDSSCAAIGSATASSYKVTSADVGHTLRVVVTAANKAGRGTATSAPTGVVPSPPPPPPPPPPPSGPVANLWIDPSGGSCARQASAGAYVDAEACGSFQAALDAAHAGDRVLARCVSGTTCTFPAETLSSAKGSSTQRIAIAAAPGQSVSFSPRSGSGVPVWLDELHNVDLTDIGFGTNNVGSGGNFDGNLRIDCSSAVTLTHATGRRFHMFEGNTDVTFNGGSWGGYSTPGEEDSSIGTTLADRPGTTCRGDRAPKPSSHITFDGVTFHDVFANTNTGQWGTSHPDCFEINGYTDHVTIQNGTFRNCGNSFFSLYGNQGYDYDLMFRNNTLRDLNDNPASQEWFGIQVHSDPNSASTPNAGRMGNIVFTGNTIDPNNPHAPGPYSGFYVTIDEAPGMAPIQITQNTLNIVQPATECANSKGAPTMAAWTANTWHTSGTPCVS